MALEPVFEDYARKQLPKYVLEYFAAGANEKTRKRKMRRHIIGGWSAHDSGGSRPWAKGEGRGGIFFF